MNDKVEELRQSLIRKFRRSQWVTGSLGVFYGLILFWWPHPVMIFMASFMGLMCLAEEWIIEKIKVVPAKFIIELNNSYKKWKL